MSKYLFESRNAAKGDEGVEKEGGTSRRMATEKPARDLLRRRL